MNTTSDIEHDRFMFAHEHVDSARVPTTKTIETNRYNAVDA